MFADPQTVTINAVAHSLPRVSGGNGTEAYYKNADQTVQLITKQNTTTKRFRREVRLVQSKIAADPLTAVNTEMSVSMYVVLDEPRYGFTDAELEYIRAGFVAWLTAGNFADLCEGQL